MSPRVCEKRVTPGPCVTVYRDDCRGSPTAGAGPGVGVHTTPLSTSLRYSTSPHGSEIGSLNQGVSRKK